DQLGTCPNCMVLPLRVGTSFIAEVNRFALATMYATDNGVDVVQEALGTLNKSSLGLDSIKYAYDHGTTVIASAADEAAQHHNWPSSYPYAIVVNSVTHTEDTDPATPTSYLQFNGCTNFSSRITLAIPSVNCSSDATGRSAGMAGLVYSAALNAREQGRLDGNPDCHRVDGSECAITPNEVRQVMASGSWDGVPAADDVNFAQDPATGADTDQGCGGHPIPGCTDPFEPLTASAPRETAPTSYPARKGHDQFYGYGRVHMSRAVSEVEPKSGDSNIPPEVELTSPGWFDMVDPAKPNLSIDGHVWDRGRPYTCKVYVAPGAYPKDTTEPNGDFVELPSGICNGQTRTDPVDGAIASASVADIKALFSPNTGDFTGPEGGASGQTPNPTGNVGRPNDEPYAFVVKVVATTVDQSPEMTGTDRTQAYLHRDQDMIAGFPKLLPGDIEASPVLADLDGDNRNELIVANSDGVVHAWRRDGSELPGWPVHTDEIDAMHDGSPAVSSGAVKPAYGA
ncbi:MAG: S8 family serine peptidase, partial [Chloroflexota bacterium]